MAIPTGAVSTKATLRETVKKPCYCEVGKVRHGNLPLKLLLTQKTGGSIMVSLGRGYMFSWRALV